MGSALKRIVKSGKLRIPGNIERTFFFWATVAAVLVYLANRLWVH